MKTILQDNILNKVRYDELGDWKFADLASFGRNTQLFWYQKGALESFIKTLYLYFSNYKGETEEQKIRNAKQALFDMYKEEGLDSEAFAVYQNPQRGSKQYKEAENKRFKLLSEYFEVEDPYLPHEARILSYNFINRMAFWMATGSGKSLVLIKAIEILDYLQSLGLIPKRDILILLPREDLVQQLKKEIDKFNEGASRKIDFLDLKEWENEGARLSLGFNTIKVYYYRSDLLRLDKKEKILDYKAFDNDGKWYLFLDEAHRGVSDASMGKTIFQILSRNGFLFNFSATFVDEIDRATTAYNFNLEKFIISGYGKNIYLSNSNFTLPSDNDFTAEEKQKHVLKSLLTFAIVKKSRKNKKLYHAPLFIALVNTVNTDDSDLLLFFKELERIAVGKFADTLFESVKSELKKEFSKHNKYVFGDEVFESDLDLLESLSKQDLPEAVFNTKEHGKIEFLEGEKGKEIAMKLQNADKIFALIKIGDTGKFKKEQLGIEYNWVESFETRKYFESINEREEINLLIGSRSFYEGWDSNRPNVITMINIGSREARKFVLQGIGRGVRIEPKKYDEPEKSRKRLPQDDKDKNILLETLFVYATDKRSVETVLKEIENEKTSKDEVELGGLFDISEFAFDLLVPRFKVTEEKLSKKAKFNIDASVKEKFLKYLENISDSVFLLNYSLRKDEVEEIKSEDFYQEKEGAEKGISSLHFDYLLGKVASHVKRWAQEVDKVEKIDTEKDIVHFRQVKAVGLNKEEIENLIKKIEEVKHFEEVDKKVLALKYAEGEISEEEFEEKINAKPQAEFKDLKIKKVLEHYYIPIIYSLDEKVEYIKHIIKTPSEVRFLEHLEKFITEHKEKINSEWMFSKIEEKTDNIYIPYYHTQKNDYLKFYPDFIFWIKNGNDYKIIFVDPKGTAHTDYESKVDAFENLFLDKTGRPKIFEYKNFKVTFDLRLVTDDVNKVRGTKYERYWWNENNFDFLVN